MTERAAGQAGRERVVLSGHTGAWFAGWISEGLSCLTFGDCPPDTDPFQGINHLRDHHGQVLPSVVDVVNTYFSQHQKDAWKDGLRLAAQRLVPWGREARALARQITDLAIGTAAQDALIALSGLLAEHGTPEDASLVVRLIDALERWAKPHSPEIAATIRQLAKQPGFDDGHARRALLVLCKAEPAKLPDHLHRLHSYLQERYDPDVCRADHARRTERRTRVLEIVSQVDHRPAALWHALFGWEDRVSEGQPAGTAEQQHDWLFAAYMTDAEARAALRSAIGPTLMRKRYPSPRRSAQASKANVWQTVLRQRSKQAKSQVDAETEAEIRQAVGEAA